MIRAFELAVAQLGDPKLRVFIWWSLLLSLVLQVGIGVLAWWAEILRQLRMEVDQRDHHLGERRRRGRAGADAVPGELRHRDLDLPGVYRRRRRSPALPATRQGARHPDLDRHLDGRGVPAGRGGAQPRDAAPLYR